MSRLGRVLTIAGSDSGGGAGIQADLKTINALGGYGASAITALTAQNTLGVQAIEKVSPEFVGKQIRAVVEDIGVDAVKTGMLHSREVVETVCTAMDELEDHADIVVDPVIVATSGDLLIEAEGLEALKRSLIPMSTVLTPNIPEAEKLTGQEITSVDEMKKAGEVLLALGAENVLIKGGHLQSDILVDVLMTQEATSMMTSPRIDTRHTHGTGCTLSAAIATGLALGAGIEEAVEVAREFVRAAIEQAPGLGSGNGPLNHAPREERG